MCDWELQMKSERKPIKILSLKSMPSLHDMDVAEYSKNGFRCWDMRQWVTQPVIGIPLRRMPNFIYV